MLHSTSIMEAALSNRLRSTDGCRRGGGYEALRDLDPKQSFDFAREWGRSR